MLPLASMPPGQFRLARQISRRMDAVLAEFGPTVAAEREAEAWAAESVTPETASDIARLLGGGPRSSAPLDLGWQVVANHSEQIPELLDCPNPESGALRVEVGVILELGILSLDERQRQVIKKRLGWDGKESTLEEIGDSFGVTKERIRQIETKVIICLKEWMKRHWIEGEPMGATPVVVVDRDPLADLIAELRRKQERNVTLRTLLRAFGRSGRSAALIARIKSGLAQHDLTTVPDICDALLDEHVYFRAQQPTEHEQKLDGS